MAHLLRRRDDGSEERLELQPGENILGRGRSSQLAVDDQSLSRRHVRLDVELGFVMLYDLESSNGTFVGDVRVQKHRLQDGDAFRCGDVHFRLVQEPAPPAGKAPENPTVALSGLLKSGHTAIRLQAAEPAERAAQKLEILLRTSQVLSSPEPQSVVLERVFDLLFQVFEVHRAALLLKDDAGVLETRLTRTREGQSPVVYSRQIVELVAASREGLLAADATTDSRLEGALSVQLAHIRSAMCAPLVIGDALLGVLYIDHLGMPGRYTQEDLDFLCAFASQAAIAVDNARLLRRLQEEASHRGSLLRFFPPAIAQALLDSRDFGAAPNDHEVTVLFSDLSGFTQMSSTMAPRDIVAILNRYFPVMAEIVFRHEGTLEKYIGDALMAIWGAPTAHADDADRAVRAAVEMQQALEKLNAELPRPLEAHIGLNSGTIAFGNIGSREYVQYAAIGDPTNVASRVCSLAQSGEVLISEATRSRLCHEIPLDALPPAMVKGKDVPLQVYRVRRGQ